MQCDRGTAPAGAGGAVAWTAAHIPGMTSAPAPVGSPLGVRPRTPLRFDRHELAGAFGDLGTDLPLLVGVILAAGLDPAMAFVVFGGLQVLTGVVYRLPMPVQPLKAMAAVVIAQQLAGPVLVAGGVIVGVTMLVLAQTGALTVIARVVPKAVVRGIQLGLGLQLGLLALRRFLPQEGAGGWVLAAVALVVVLALRGNRRVPAAIVVVSLGLGWAWATWPDGVASPWSPRLPVLPERWPSASDFLVALPLLALPQLALSLGNSVLATRQVAQDLFPDREPLTVRRIGTTYALMNLVSAPLGGIPVCHGSGGMVGHYAFGGRSGGSVVLYGLVFIAGGLMLSADPVAFARLVPGPVLGVLLLVEAVGLMRLLRDQLSDRAALAVAVVCGVTAVAAPYGYAVALVGGTVGWYALRRVVRRTSRSDEVMRAEVTP